MVPGASPGPPRGLPEASLGPPGAILEDMQRNAKKQEKQKGSPDPIFQKNVKFTDPGWTPKSSRSGPESEQKVKNDVLFDATVGVTVLGGSFFRQFQTKKRKSAQNTVNSDKNSRSALSR